MELYKNSDLNLIDNNIDKIVDEIETIRKNDYPRPNDNKETETESNTKSDPELDSESDIKKSQIVSFPTPSIEDVNAIVLLTLDFIKKKKRKIYGGYAQNKVIKEKNKDDAFYDDSTIPDIDVYSPSPIEDLVELCDMLYKNGYTDVIGKEAQHKETYKIFTKKYNAIDLSYVPQQIYNNIPCVEIDNIKYVHPSFSMIDLYKMMTEPLFSSWRWKKIFPRLHSLQKHYPIKTINGNLNTYKHKHNMSNPIKVIENFILNNNSVYLFGDVAYNYFVKKSNNMKKANVHVGMYQIVSTNYKYDALLLIDKLKKANVSIKYDEYYPFWSFTCYSTEILYKGSVIAKIYNHLKRCCPVIKIDHTYESITGYVQIGSFDYILLMEMILMFRQKVLRNNDRQNYHGQLITNLITMRNKYLHNNNKTLLDNTIFQSFVIPCIGKASDPKTEALKSKKEKKEKNKYGFMYKPVREIKGKWMFSNTSGNIINNTKNLRLKNN
jgi:hypothetical protein